MTSFFFQIEIFNNQKYKYINSYRRIEAAPVLAEKIQSGNVFIDLFPPDCTQFAAARMLGVGGWVGGREEGIFKMLGMALRDSRNSAQAPPPAWVECAGSERAV